MTDLYLWFLDHGSLVLIAGALGAALVLLVALYGEDA